MTSVAPIQGTSESNITITGSGFSGTSCHNKVMFGSHSCVVTFSNESMIVCRLDTSKSPQAGVRRQVSVQVANRGHAMVFDEQPTHFVLKPRVTSLSPQDGSIKGGTKVTISGDGFSQNIAENVVLIGGKTCAVTSALFDSIVCITQESDRESGQKATVTVSGIESECTASNIGGCDYTFTTSKTPVVDSISPKSIDRTETEFRISVSRLPASISDVTVTIGNKVCQVTEMSSGRLKCTFVGIAAGDHKVNVHVLGKGNSIFDGPSEFISSKAVVSSLWPSQSSINGGLNLTIKGNGFDPVPDRTTVTIGGQQCDLISVTFGEIICVTPPHSSQDSVTVQVTVTPPGVSRRRRSDLSIPFPPITMSYTNAATPQLDSLSLVSGKEGDILTISGSGLDPSNGEVIIDIGGAPCLVNTSAENKVVCTLSAHPAGRYSVNMWVPGKGRATSRLFFMYDLGIDAVNPNESGFGGGRELIIQGCGFDTSAVVHVCGKECSLTTSYIATTTLLKCEAPMNPNYASGGDRVCDVQVSVNGVDTTLEGGFTYRATLTSQIFLITPSRGGTGGGTSLTIIGSGFSVDPNKNLVSIDGTPCITSFSNSSVIQCRTGEHGRTIETKVRVEVDNNGKALNDDGDFFYVDVWSSRFTWGNQDPPREGKYYASLLFNFHTL